MPPKWSGEEKSGSSKWKYSSTELEVMYSVHLFYALILYLKLNISSISMYKYKGMEVKQVNVCHHKTVITEWCTISIRQVNKCKICCLHLVWINYRLWTFKYKNVSLSVILSVWPREAAKYRLSHLLKRIVCPYSWSIINQKHNLST